MQETSGELDPTRWDDSFAPQDEGAAEDLTAVLELQEGQLRVPVYYSLREAEGGVVGYLRLAYGQGNAANRLLAAGGGEGRLIGADGASRLVTILSTDPSEAPGYLCAFALR